MERWMLEYDRAFACTRSCPFTADSSSCWYVIAIHTPSCVWRRTGEIQKANQEFANLTGIPASMFRNGVLCVYELMDEDSAVRYWEGYAKIAFDAGRPCSLFHLLLVAHLCPRTKGSLHIMHAESPHVPHSTTRAPIYRDSLFKRGQVRSPRRTGTNTGLSIATASNDKCWGNERCCIVGYRSRRDGGGGLSGDQMFFQCHDTEGRVSRVGKPDCQLMKR